METKYFQLDLKADDAGMVEGYGSVFGNRDSYGDIVEAGAFSSTIRSRKPKMLWQHNMADPIGVWDEVSEDDRGLRVKGRLAMATTRGREAYELVKLGALDGLSIGFRTVKDEIEGAVRKLKEIDLYEVSFVTMPANAAATITDIRSVALESERSFEAFLRQHGFSRWDAKIITAGGWKEWQDRRDAECRDLDADQRDAEAIKTQLLQLLNGVSQCRT